MIELLGFINHLISLYVYIIFASVILSWLMGFGVVNPHNPTVRAIYQALQAVTEPLLRPIRRIMPDLGAIDISPIVLLLACEFLKSVVIPNIAKVAV
jgi:YggT family protein